MPFGGSGAGNYGIKQGLINREIRIFLNVNKQVASASGL